MASAPKISVSLSGYSSLKCIQIDAFMNVRNRGQAVGLMLKHMRHKHTQKNPEAMRISSRTSVHSPHKPSPHKNVRLALGSQAVAPQACTSRVTSQNLVDVGRGATILICLQLSGFGFQPLNHNKQKCKMFPNDNHDKMHYFPLQTSAVESHEA